MKFRKKPITIDAIQWTGDNIEEIGEFLSGVHWATAGRNAVIPTREGDMAASPNDWIIKGIAGEFYPCKPDIFAATYEPEDPQRPCHADNIERITDIINERLRPENLDIQFVVNTVDTYNIQVSNRATGPRWSFHIRARNGVIRDSEGEGGSWSLMPDRHEWLTSAAHALLQAGISNFYLHVEEL
jgi:hypothetical protein